MKNSNQTNKKGKKRSVLGKILIGIGGAVVGVIAGHFANGYAAEYKLKKQFPDVFKP
jgi:ABC-type phosphate transport system permease subunit